MILKVTGFIWSMNAALTRRNRQIWRGAVKKWPEIRARALPGTRRRHRIVAMLCRKFSQPAIFA